MRFVLRFFILHWQCIYKQSGLHLIISQQMFCYNLPNGGLHTRTYLNAEGQVKFDPPVYEQRYTTAIRILEDARWGRQFKKVVDFGCAEMRLLALMRNVEFVEHILEVDIDEDLLRANRLRADPLVSDYLNKRETPLRVEVLKGSIDAPVEQLCNVDAVIALEIIEHLYPNVLEKVPENVFGFIKPKIAIFSTPNSEYNVLFGPLLPNGFRHLDHKFEWTRAEFKKWALDICHNYPNYGVAIIGVGEPIPDKKHIGHVTQIAIFVQNYLLNRPAVLSPCTNILPDCSTDKDIQYQEIYAVDFPYHYDDRSKEKKLLDEARYHINRQGRSDRYFNRDLLVYQMPLRVFTEYLEKIDATINELITVLKDNDIQVKGDYIILPEEDECEIYDDTGPDEFELDKEDDEELGAWGYTPLEQNVFYDSDEIWD